MSKKISSSLPDVREDFYLTTASQGSQKITLTTNGRITPDQRDENLQVFNNNRDIYLQTLQAEKTAKEDAVQQVESDIPDNIYAYEIARRGLYYYFIGRLNPPHEGHIEALLNVISNAIVNRGIAIILLGSGPNGGERTSKDPLDFGLKSEFVISKLKDKLKDRLKDILKVDYPKEYIDELFENGTIQILEMGKTTEQIRQIIRDDISNQLFEELEAIRIAGDKEGDVKKWSG